MEQYFLITEVSRSPSDTPKSVENLWTSGQPGAETSTQQNTTLTRVRHARPRGIRTRNLSKQTAAEPRLRPRDQWERLDEIILN